MSYFKNPDTGQTPSIRGNAYPMKIIQESRPTTAAVDARDMALAFPVADEDGKFVCPCDGKVYGSLKSLRNHLNTVHREEYVAARERMCGQVVPGPLPTEDQLVAWRRNPVVGRGAAGLLAFDTSMLAGIRVTPGGQLDVPAVIARFRGVDNTTARFNLAAIIRSIPPIPGRVGNFDQESGDLDQESAGTRQELASQITYFQFEKGDPTAVAFMHVNIQLLMLLPGPESAALRAVTGEVYIRANVNDLDLRQAMEQKGASISREVDDVVMADLPRSEEAKQESKERVREGDDENWLHASPGPEAEARAVMFRGFSALDDLVQAKLLCLIYKGIDRAEFADAMCAEIDAALARELKQAAEKTKQAEETTKTVVAQETTKQAEEATKQAEETTKQVEETTKATLAQEATKAIIAQESTKQEEERTKAVTKQAEEQTKQEKERAKIAKQQAEEQTKQEEERAKAATKQAEEQTKQEEERAKAATKQAEEQTKQEEERARVATKQAEEQTQQEKERTKQAEEATKATTKKFEEDTKQAEERTKAAREAAKLAEENTKTVIAQEATKQAELATKAATKQAEESTKATIAQEATKQARANVLRMRLELKTLRWKRKHCGSESADSSEPDAVPDEDTSPAHPCFAAEDQDDLVRKLQHLAEVARSPFTLLTNADCANITTDFRTVEELDNFLDELDLHTRDKVWPHEKRQLDAVDSSMAKVNGKLVTHLVRDGRATLHVCSYRRRRTGCFYFGLGFNG